nr:hypothetical protein [Tanacetum cinerariifolium]
EHLDTIPATKSDEVIKSSVEDLVPIPSESEGIPDTMCDVHLVNNSTPLEAKDHVEIVINSTDDISSIEEIEDDNLREKLLNVHLLIANIEVLKDNPTQSSELLAKSSSTSLNSFLEETNTFHNSLPEFENFYFDLGEISSGSTTTHSDISLPDYEAFYFDGDHIKEISSGSTTTHSDISLSEYDSFIFDFTHGQQALQRRKLPGALASRHKGLNLDKSRQASLLQQKNQCRLPLRWKSPHIQSLKQNKTFPATHGSIQLWISKLAKQSDSRSSFNELMDTPVDFSAFLMNRLKVNTLNLKLLAGPTYELMKGSCKSLVELEFFLEEVYKAMTDQLDWVNPEGQQYPNNLLKPNSRGRHVIPFDHFINNDLEYLRGGTSSHKYTTSVTKTKAADYGHIKWIEDLMPRAMWIQEPRRIIAVTELKIVEWHNYKHLDWITKKLNLTKPDTYRSDLKRKEAYITYSNPRGFIYQNKDKQNRLMRIDELHKFSDGTLIDVRTALDDRLKGSRMKYLPQTIWRKSDKEE